MMRALHLKFWILALGVGLTSALTQGANAAAPANNERIALVIGNGAYKSAPLANPVNDATDVAAALRKSGFNVTLRTNVNRAQMRAAVRDFGEALRRGQVGLFYFAGHGIESKGKNFLIPLAANMASEFELEDEAMDANTVLRAMEDAGNATNIMILDACRDNPFARSWRSASRGLAQMNAPTGSFIAFATAPGSVASDGTGRNGTFTKHLLSSLNQPDLDIDRVFTRVTAGVAQETGKKQVPWKSSSLTGAFSFGAGEQVSSINPPSAAVDPSANERTYWDSVKDTKSPAELNAYLTRFPSGLFVELAQARLKVLLTPIAPPVQVATVTSNVTAKTPQAAAAPFTKTDTVVGKGKEATPGNLIFVNYTGWLHDAKAPNNRGKQFDSSQGRGPFSFLLGQGRVIKGWDEGVAGMKVGGKRTLIIPPAMGYGEPGAGDVIPPNATLVFDVELLDVR